MNPDHGVADRVLRSAAAAPDASAVEDEQHRLTYGELVAAARRVAVGLKRRTSAGDLLPIVGSRGTGFVTACLGAWLAGLVYVPIDERLPAARRDYMIQDCGARLVLTASDRATDLPANTVTLAELSARTDEDTDPGRPPRTGGDDAYAIYTSGTTGLPKATVLRHRGLANLVDWHNHAYAVGPGTRALHTAGLSFDASVWEIWPYLCAGATVVTAPEEVRMIPSRLVGYARAQRTTKLFASTPLAQEILRTCPDDEIPWTELFTGGDALRLSRLPSGWDLINHYGPTEATVVATAWRADHVPADGLAPIGGPIRGVSVRLVAPDLSPAAPGSAGELLIGGPGVARGYHDRPHLTAARFVHLPGEPGTWYRTGDLARADDAGGLWFLGRVDDQIQVRGVRAEPAEIEGALLKHPAIVRAAVALFGPADRRGLGAAVVTSGPLPSFGVLRGFLRASIPEGIVPSRVVVVDELPLTPNGKIDRRAVAGMFDRHLPGPGADQERTAHEQA